MRVAASLWRMNEPLPHMMQMPAHTHTRHARTQSCLKHTRTCMHTFSRMRARACVRTDLHTQVQTCAHPMPTHQHAPQAAGGGGSIYPEQMAMDRSPFAAAVVCGADPTSPQRMPFTRLRMGGGTDSAPPVPAMVATRASAGSRSHTGSGGTVGDPLGRASAPVRRPHPHAPTVPPTRPLTPAGANTAARAAHWVMRASRAGGAPGLSAPLPLAATLPGTPSARTPE